MAWFVIKPLIQVGASLRRSAVCHSQITALTVNLSFPNGSCAYGILWNTTDIVFFHFLISFTLLSVHRVCSCRENAASVFNELSVALSNISLTTIILASRSEIGMCIYLGDCLKITLSDFAAPMLQRVNHFCK